MKVGEGQEHRGKVGKKAERVGNWGGKGVFWKMKAYIAQALWLFLLSWTAVLSA